MHRILWSCIALVVVAGQAQAGPIFAPDSVIANTMGTSLGDITYTFDQSGLSVGYVDGVTDFDTYVASSPSHAVPLPFPINLPNYWAGAIGPVFGHIDFDLGASMMLESLALWTTVTTESINEFEVLVADNVGFAGATNLGAFNGAQSLIVQEFATPATGRYVRLQVNSINGAADRVILSEIAFERGITTNPIVPEPTSLALLGIGSGLLGLCRVRRRNQNASSAA